MASITVTINDNTGGPYNLAQLFAGNTYLGKVTIAPVTPTRAQSQPNYISVQADPANSTNYLVLGDSKITATAGGKRLAAGNVDVMQGPGTVSLAERYIQASVNGVIANIEALGGKQ